MFITIHVLTFIKQIASLYEDGEGVDKDIDESFIWYKKAADQGDSDAQHYLGNNVDVIFDVQYVHVYIYNNRICIPRG